MAHSEKESESSAVTTKEGSTSSTENSSSLDACPHPGLHKGYRQCSFFDFENFSEEGNFLIREELSKRVPDKAELYIQEMDFLDWCRMFERNRKKMNLVCLVLNEHLRFLRWYSTKIKQKYYRLIGETLREVETITCLTAEFGHFLHGDGLRLLLGIALGGGSRLKFLHMWRLFKPGLLQAIINTDEAEGYIDLPEYEVTEETMKDSLWNLFVQKYTSAFSADEALLILSTSLQCFDNLVVLSIAYSLLSYSRGTGLWQLGCIRTGSLRKLNILFSHYEVFQDAKKNICKEAWISATQWNPHFRVTLCAMRTGDYEHLAMILLPYMPLENVFASNVYCRPNTLRLDLIARLLILNYKATLKKLTFRVCSRDEGIVYTLKRILTQLPNLEDFEYKGPIDVLRDLHGFLKTFLQTPSKLRSLHFYLFANEIEIKETLEDLKKYVNEKKLNFTMEYSPV